MLVADEVVDWRECTEMGRIVHRGGGASIKATGGWPIVATRLFINQSVYTSKAPHDYASDE
jgi:hypothetical protein